ncbi:MAG: hypothetical protein K2X87_00855 [Gemmataceae bacterium]|nr:hypothetical protein [Gemmataceae bacterium]
MKTTLLGLTLAAAVGCVQMQPVGPLAKSIGTPKGPAPAAAADDPADPVTVPAPRPTAPALFVVPAEVSADNPAAAAQKLMAEFESDRKSTPAPRPEVSVIKGGVKQ